jgi:hypothetical protein
MCRMQCCTCPCPCFVDRYAYICMDLHIHV